MTEGAEARAVRAWEKHCEMNLSGGAWFDLDYQFGFRAGFLAALNPDTPKEPE